MAERNTDKKSQPTRTTRVVLAGTDLQHLEANGWVLDGYSIDNELYAIFNDPLYSGPSGRIVITIEASGSPEPVEETP